MQTRTGSAAKLLAFAELALSPSSYLDPAGSLANITDILAQRQWIETLVIALEKLVALSVSLSLNARWPARLVLTDCE